MSTDSSDSLTWLVNQLMSQMSYLYYLLCCQILIQDCKENQQPSFPPEPANSFSHPVIYLTCACNQVEENYLAILVSLPKPALASILLEFFNKLYPTYLIISSAVGYYFMHFIQSKVHASTILYSICLFKYSFISPSFRCFLMLSFN